MDELVDISIIRTETRHKSGCLNSSYTVYELKVIIDDSYQYFIYKRYKEFRKLYDDVKETLGHNYKLPKFPGKTLHPMKSATINKRKLELENWILGALAVEDVDDLLKIFLGVKDNYEILVEEHLLNEDEVVIRNFSESINGNSNQRMSLLDTFEKMYFSKRRIIREKQIGTLLGTLLPLCGDEFIGSKSLYVLYKLCTRDHNKDFDIFMQGLTKMPIDMLKRMKLDEYLLKKRYSESQIQAFHILNILKSHLDTKAIIDILNNNLEACEVYLKWDSPSCIGLSLTKAFTSSPDWMTIPLFDLNNGLQIAYRFINNQLQFHAIFAVESNFETIVNLLIQPESRKKWDLKLVDIEKIPNENERLCLKMLYSQDKSLYEFHNDVSINWSIYHTTVNFCSNQNTKIKPKGVLGKMSSYYKLENLSKADSSFALNYKKNGVKRVSSCVDNLQESIGSHLELIKVTWKASFCEFSKKMFIADCLEETNLLKNTIAGLIQMAEKPSESLKRSPQNSLFTACERKRLKSSV